MPYTTRRLTAITVLVVLGAMAGSAMATPDEVTARGSPVIFQEGTEPAEPANNSTQHENPDEVSENGDLDQVSGWLNSRLASQLSESTLQLSQGEYEQARGVIGDDYNDMLSKYVDVAGETAGSGDDETAEEFEEAQAEQQEYVSAVQDYWETREEYREAKANGNESRARELARNLSETAGRIQELNGTLTESYRSIGNQTGASLADEAAVIQNMTQNITADQQEITEAEFVATRLTVATEQESIAFTDPLRIQGTVHLENGTVVAGETATILVAGQSYQVALDADGQFNVTYRPIRHPVAVDSIQVQYRPADTSPYLGSNTTVPVSIEQTTPDVAVSVNATEVSYGDVVRIRGRVAANETPVPGLPVVLTLGSRSAGSVDTDADGMFSTRVRIGSTLQTGAQALRAAAGDEARAIGAANSETTLRVVETPTELTLQGTVRGDRVVLSGQLATNDGRPIPGQTIELALADQQVISVTTNETGHFQTAVETETYDPNSHVRIAAAFHGAGTNLASAQAETVVQIPAQSTRLPSDRQSLILGLVGVLAVCVGGWLMLRRRETDPGDSGGDESSGQDTSAVTSASATSQGLRAAVGAALTIYNEGASGGAVERLYPAVRQYLTRVYDLPESGTHWEFYTAVAADDSMSEWAPVVRALTEAYEQVRFAEAAVDDADVEAVLERLDEHLDALWVGSDS